MSNPTRDFSTLDDFVATSEPWFRTQLKAMVEHRTVSPGGGHEAEIAAGAAAAASLMESCGARARVVPSSGTPSIIGHFPADNPRRRIVIYNHFDVQPANPANWRQDDPFRFEVEADAERGFVYLGRGTTDDKGPALCGLRAAQFIRECGLPIDVVLLWETEEEIGSPNFRDVLRAERELISSDGIIVSDTIWPNSSQPAMSMGLRGGLTATLHLRTASKDAHSGLVGGAARNPVRELCGLADAIERAGFWREGARPVDDAEVAQYLASGFDLDYFKSSHGLERLSSEIPLELMLRIWAQPSYDVHGLAGGYQGPGVKSAVPPEAELKISFRTVPGQDHLAIADGLRRFVALQAPDVVVEIQGGFAAYESSPSGPVHDAIVTGMKRAFGRKPVPVREGGSIGAVPMMESELGVPVHFLPLSLPEHGYHAPNERFDWKQARGGVVAFADAFAALSR